MKTGGLSTNIKYTLIKILEDLIILKTFFKQYFLIHYLKKVIIKIKGFCFIHKKLYFKKKLKFIHKNLNKNF